MAGLSLRQYTYFAIKSADLPAGEIERRLGISADRVLVPDTLAFLADIRADFDVDEYG
jgi:hypothetical protein